MIAGALGNTIGNILLYEVSRRKGLEYIAAFKLFPETEIKKVQAAFTLKGSLFLFVGKLLPSIKVFVPIVAGIGKANRVLFTVLMMVSSLIWTIPFLSVGYVLGKSTDFFAQYVVILMVVALIVVYGFYRYINSEGVKQAMATSQNEPS
jgi:membrane-associated protein